MSEKPDEGTMTTSEQASDQLSDAQAKDNPGHSDEASAHDLPPGAVRVTIRRSPKFANFIGLGVFVGFLIGAILVAFRPETDQTYSVSTLVGYLGVIGAGVGGLIGAALAVLVDRRSMGD